MCIVLVKADYQHKGYRLKGVNSLFFVGELCRNSYLRLSNVHRNYRRFQMIRPKSATEGSNSVAGVSGFDLLDSPWSLLACN